jgi:peptidylprolyl isomerase
MAHPFYLPPYFFLSLPPLCSYGPPRRPALAETQPVTDPAFLLCSASCEADLADKPRIKTASGLEYIDLVEGTGPSPPVGFLVTVAYVAMLPTGRVISSSLERGSPYDIRVGAGQVVKGESRGREFYY